MARVTLSAFTERPWWATAVFYQVYPRSFADGNGDIHLLGSARGAHTAVMLGALFVCLPVHSGGALVKNLHAIAAAVAFAGIGVL